jgi:tetratricopeptide (TPR) repeat protein
MKNLFIGFLIVISLLIVVMASGCSVLSPNRALEYYNQGVTLSDAGKYDEAIAEYNKSIESNPNFVSSYLNLGYVYYQKKQYDLAIKNYTKVIELSPDEYKAYTGRGASYLMTKQYKQALSDFDMSLKLNPSQDQVVSSRAYAAKMLDAPITPTTTPPPTTSIVTLQSLNGNWLNSPGKFGMVLYDGGSRWSYNVELSLQEDGLGKFHGTMKRTLLEITGPVTSEPEIMKWIGDIQTAEISGTRVSSIVDFKFGDLTLHLTVNSDSYGVYLQGDTHFFDTGSAVGAFKGLTDIRPAGVSGQDYIEWIYSINLKRK